MKYSCPPAFIRIVVFVQKVLLSCVPSKEDGQEGDAGGSYPGKDDHHDGRPHSDGRVVDQGLGDGVVSIVQRSLVCCQRSLILLRNVLILL